MNVFVVHSRRGALLPVDRLDSEGERVHCRCCRALDTTVPSPECVHWRPHRRENVSPGHSRAVCYLGSGKYRPNADPHSSLRAHCIRLQTLIFWVVLRSPDRDGVDGYLSWSKILPKARSCRLYQCLTQPSRRIFPQYRFSVVSPSQIKPIKTLQHLFTLSFEALDNLKHHVV